MNSRLTYVKFDIDYKEIGKIEELYSNAFPPEERIFTVREALERENDPVTAVAVYDGGTLIGFYALTVHEEYSYLAFFAVDANIRNKGYGGEIIRKLLDENKGRIFIGHIEKPIPGEDDYEIKTRRKNFYERNGMIIVDKGREVNGVKFLTITNKTGEVFERCIKIEADKVERMLKDN